MEEREIQQLPNNGLNTAGRTLAITVPEPDHGFDGGGLCTSDSGWATTANDAPEKKLTLLAFRLAILEKAASALGSMGFVWATVVLLGGFASVIRTVDFWVITIILLIESTRIFSRSHELEWQHQELTRARRRRLQARFTSLSDSFTSSFSFSTLFQGKQKPTGRTSIPSGGVEGKKERRWIASDVLLLPSDLFRSGNISKFLYWLQLASATACVVLCAIRLVKNDYDKGIVEPPKIMKPAIIIFYALLLAEALLYLLERAYWNFEFKVHKLFERVNHDCGFDPDGIHSIKRFYYDAYSKCINGSIFDGLDMDLVTYAEGLLVSDSSTEQLMAVRIIEKFASNDRFSVDTLRKVETTRTTVERLIEMLNWKSLSEVELRTSAAVVVARLARKSENSLRVAAFPGSMESISCLLHTGRSTDAKPYEIPERRVVIDLQNYEYSAFNLLGLSILKELAQDHENCARIGNTRGLLAKIIDFTSVGERVLGGGGIPKAPSQKKTMKLALVVLKLLASTTGETGTTLRHQIADTVFTISNLREILQFGEGHRELQVMAVEILTSLAMQKEARERIGLTGGVMRDLFAVFFSEGGAGVAVAAGEALAMLALESEGNSIEMLKLGVVGKLVGALDDGARKVYAGRILRNLCAYSGEKGRGYLGGVSAAIPTVLKEIMNEEEIPLEASIGLAAQIYTISSSEEFLMGFNEARVKEIELVEKLVQILTAYKQPSVKLPRIRRFVIQLSVVMMKSSEMNIRSFNQKGLKKELGNILETTSSLECFNTFSGSVGLNHHYISMHSLVDSALEILGSFEK